MRSGRGDECSAPVLHRWPDSNALHSRVASASLATWIVHFHGKGHCLLFTPPLGFACTVLFHTHAEKVDLEKWLVREKNFYFLAVF